MLRDCFSRAIAEVSGRASADVDPLVKSSGDPKFGDYQCNAAMSLAKTLGAKPREIAERIAAAAAPLLGEIAEPLEIAGPGFLNIRLKSALLEQRLAAIEPEPGNADADRFGIAAVAQPETVVVDYSSPNIAKQMHVGHLRSTIIGDSLARVLAFAGHRIVRQNHVGDWGTQFGMVILALWHLCMARHRKDDEYVGRMLGKLTDLSAGDGRVDATVRAIYEQHQADLAVDGARSVVFKPWLANHIDKVTLDALEEGYRFVTALEKAAERLDLSIQIPEPEPGDPSEVQYHRLSRFVTAMLQRGHERDKPERDAWRYSIKITLDYCDSIYAQLGILLRTFNERGEIDSTVVRGESFYNPLLPGVIEALRRDLPPRDAASQNAPWAEFRVDNGAACVFMYGADGDSLYKNPDGAPLPLIVQKSDGAFLYATTDLAAIRFRTGHDAGQLGAKRVLYVVGAPTKLHLEMVFRCARLAAWIGEDVRLEHVSFGQVLGEDRKLLRTRSGGAVKLRELLDEAQRRAADMIDSRLAEELPGERPSFSAEEKTELARRIGVGAVKYFDLARDRNGDYVFNYDQMLALQGNTAPYMLYAYARIRSIDRKATERLHTQSVSANPERAPLRLEHPAERALALRLLRLAEAIDVVAADLTPHVLCGYAYELAGDFMRFYEACPVLQAPEAALQLSRLRLTALTARALRIALGLVGIEVVERM